MGVFFLLWTEYIQLLLSDQCLHYKTEARGFFWNIKSSFSFKLSPASFLFSLRAVKSSSMLSCLLQGLTQTDCWLVILILSISQTKNIGLSLVFFFPPVLQKLCAYSLFLLRQLMTQFDMEPISNRTVSSFCGIQIQYGITNLELKKRVTSCLFKHSTCSDQTTLLPWFFNHRFWNLKP